jgi:hypothetical protein
VSEPAAARRIAYSPDLRTAVVLTGTGADGAYHAGVLQALQEAGVRVDLLAGHGIGAVGALFAAIDGGTRLWNANGLWRSRGVARLYPWRGILRVLGLSVIAGGLILTVPAVMLALGLIVYEAASLLDLAGPGTAARVTMAYADFVGFAFAPEGLPTWLPRLALALVTFVVGLVAISALRATARLPARKRQRGGFWWSTLGAPMSAADASSYFRRGLWDLLRGGAAVREPDPTDLGRRVSELVTDNLSQPGFRELLLVVHDLDAERDLVFALLGADARRSFFLRKPVSGDRRSAEAFDLSGVSRDHMLHVVAGALALPAICEPEQVGFPPESYWRGETHRICDRPGALVRVLEEAAAAGARQVLIVTSAPDMTGPHGLSARRVTPRARLSEFLATAQAAAVRDAMLSCRPWFDRVFVVRPVHNAIGPLDLAGAFDERSDRTVRLTELIDRGYEDAYRQFIEPVVGASGEALEAERRPARADG